MDESRLVALQQRLVRQLPEDSRFFARIARSALIADDIARERRNLLNHLHRLAGRCSQLGFDELGGGLAALERRLEQTEPANGPELAQIANTASDSIDETLLNNAPRAPRVPPGRYLRVTATAGKTALVVEDDPELGPLARGALNDLGFAAVRLAKSSERALAECYVLKPDLIVCDWRLRNASGLDFLKTIRNGGVSGLEATPFIMLTGQRDKKSVQTALREGADDFIVKPFAIGRLRQAVSRLISPPDAFEDALAV
jgi:CheY-like chemotaxis protein